MTVEYKLYQEVTGELKARSRQQRLAAAALGLERLWPMFEEWTTTEGHMLLYRRPAEFQTPVRRMLDACWQQIDSETAIKPLQEQYSSLLRFMSASFDEDDGPNVDFAAGKPLIDELFCGVRCFFAEDSQACYASACVTAYSGYLFEKLYDECCDNESSWQPPLSKTIEETIAAHPSWQRELAEIRCNLALVNQFSGDVASLYRRREEIWRMEDR